MSGPPPAVDTSTRPFVLVWELTQACDLACDHCRAEAEPTRHPAELTTEDGKELLEEIQRFGENQLVVFSGGDPLYRDDVVELVQYGTDCGHRMTLTPSGTSSLTPDRIEALADAGLQRMALSVDGGAPESHDSFRGEVGSFSQTIAAAKWASNVGVPLQINTTVCADTVDELPAIRSLVSELGAVLWSVFFLVPIGRGRILTPISPANADDIMDWLLTVRAEESFGIKTTEAPQYRRVALQQAGGHGSPKHSLQDKIGRRTGIIAGDGFMFVSHTGDVFPSGFLPLAVGNVREESVVDLYREAPLFQSLRDRNALKGKCGACSYRNICGGSRSRAYAYTGDPLESDPLCPHIPTEYDGPLPTEVLH